MLISSPGTQHISGKQAFFSFCKKKIPYFLSFEGKKASFSGGTKFFHPRVVLVLCSTLSTSIRFVQAFGQSFSVIFTLHIIAVAVAFTTSLNYYRGQSIEIGEIFIMTFIVVDQCFQQKKTLHLSLTA